MNTRDYAEAAVTNGSLVQTRRGVEGDVESGPYTVPFYRWKWGKAEVTLALIGGYWHVSLWAGPDRGASPYGLDNYRNVATSGFGADAEEKIWTLRLLERARAAEKRILEEAAPVS